MGGGEGGIMAKLCCEGELSAKLATRFLRPPTHVAIPFEYHCRVYKEAWTPHPPTPRLPHAHHIPTTKDGMGPFLGRTIIFSPF